MSPDNPYSFDGFLNFINSNFAIILLIIIGFAAGFFTGSLWTENQSLRGGGAAAPTAQQPTAQAPTVPQEPTQDQLALVPEVTERDHIRGNVNAPITLIEYSDFQCPFCQGFSDTVEQVLEEYSDEVRLIYRHFPLGFHPQAQELAEVSECIADINGPDAFWQFHDAIFEINTASINAGTGQEVVEQLGYVYDPIQTCLDEERFTQYVMDQMDGGSTAGVSGTPGTILVTNNGEYELINGALPFEQVQTIIESYL